MKTKSFILTLSVFLVSMFSLQASLILTSGISQGDFEAAFNNDRVWYARLQPGNGDITSSQFELGGESLRYFQGNTVISDETNNPFQVNVDSENNLSVTFNGDTTDEDWEFPITEQFNLIWIGLRLATGNAFNNILEINTHEVDGTANLPDMYLEEHDNHWTAFMFYKENDLINIGEISITGNVFPNMVLGGAQDQEWTYTVFATHDPTIIPEPSSFILILGALVAALVFYRKKIN